MPIDYDKIREDNIREYGQGTRHLSFLSKLYADRTHFIFELLQNAEDAGANKILFELFDDRLEVSHNGRKFNESDVKGICGVDDGTKKEDLTKIGKFGIGFKSVYAYTATPEIYSGDECFKIENYVRPYKLSPRRLEHPWTTLFVFPFDEENISQEMSCREIGQRLLNLRPRTLLFLRKINEIEYRLAPDATGGVYLRDEVDRGNARQVSVIGQNNSKDEDESWLVFERQVLVPEKTETVRVEVSFRVETDDNAGKKKERIIKVKNSPLVVYFPTEKETRFGFLIQGPYRTTPSRDNVPNDDDWNAILVRETACLLNDVLPQIKLLGLLTVSFLESLPIRIDDFPKDSMFYPIVTAIRETLQQEDLLPADDDSFISAGNAKLARGADLRKLLTQEQLPLFFQSTEHIKWLAGEITQDRTPDLRTYLINELNIEEVTPEGFSRKINYSFLSSQSDEWFIEFFGYLSGQEALWRAPRWGRDPAGLLRAKPILRLHDGSTVEPFKSDGMTLNAFMPPPDGTDFPVVKPSIVNDEQARNFLNRLGLSEPDVFDDIIERVLPKYSTKDVSSISPQEHGTDIQKILRALTSDSDGGKKRVLQSAKQTPFLKAVDPAGNLTFQKPCNIYQDSPDLRLYFSCSTDVWFLSEETMASTTYTFILSELGVARKPRFRKKLVDLPWEEKYRLQGNLGHTRDIEIMDYDMDGLDSFLSRSPQDSLQLIRHSLIFWGFLLEYLKESSYYQFHKGQYRWYYYSERTADFTASWLKQLWGCAWMPKNGTNGPFKPGDLSLDELPEQFDRNEDLADLLGMKKDVVCKLAEEAGIPAEDIDLLRRFPEEFSRWKAQIAVRNERPVFPSRPVVNPERREERFAEQISDAPEKQYEKRERSIRITRGTIDPVQWLRNQYTNESGQMVCQICKEETAIRDLTCNH